MENYIIYIATSYINKVGTAAYSSYITHGKVQKEITKGFIDIDKQRLNIVAAIDVLNTFTKPSSIVVITDSFLLYNGFKNVNKWKENQWYNSNNNKVNNIDLWEQIADLQRKHFIRCIRCMNNQYIADLSKKAQIKALQYSDKLANLANKII